VTGVKHGTFAKMAEILAAARVEKRKKHGRKPKLSPEEMLLATLEYLREYRTYARIAASYGIDKSNMYRAIKRVEDVLTKSGAFSPPGKKALLRDGMDCEVVLVDATETPIERPKKTAQALFGQEEAARRENAGGGEEIRRADSLPGFRLQENPRLPALQGVSHALSGKRQAAAGQGYQGVGKLHGNCELPKKRTKKSPLSAEDKRGNRELSRALRFPRALILSIPSLIAAARSNSSFFARSNIPLSRPLTSFARRPETTRSRPSRSVNPASGQGESRSRGSSRTSRAGTETRNGLAPLGSSSSRREARGFRRARVFAKPVPDPFPRVPAHVVKTKLVRLFHSHQGARHSLHTTRLHQRRRSPNTRSLRASRSRSAPRTPTPPPPPSAPVPVRAAIPFRAVAASRIRKPFAQAALVGVPYRVAPGKRRLNPMGI